MNFSTNLTNMCGIAGILTLSNSLPEDLLRQFCSHLRHRGPDEQGFHFDSPIALGQTRLSIIDLSSGKQPMTNEDGSLWVTFNGEIYNFQELRNNLLQQGHRFATQSDTEVILHAYEQHGVDCVKLFRGMFAFALWDRNQRSLFLARDRVGKKPLVYSQTPKHFVFASELQALVQHPDIARTPDPLAIDDYLTYGYIPTPRTIYSNVSKLPPAHYLLAKLDPTGTAFADFQIKRYWDLDYSPKLALSEPEAIEQLLEVLTEAVHLRLIADVPLGALLSGGVDSSLVVALMCKLSNQRVKTFSIGFDDSSFNELPYARTVAQHLQTDHHELIVRPNALEIMPKLVRHYGEPYADSSAVPSYYVAQLTRQHVKVALNGDGGDESFAGYERYLGSLVADRFRRLPALLRGGVHRLAGMFIKDSLPRRSRLRQAKRLLDAAELPVGPRYLRWLSYFTPEQKQSLYTPAFRKLLSSHDSQAWFLGEFLHCKETTSEALDALLALDVRTYLRDDLLVKMDIATMACSLEARSPLLDHQVMEFAARLPTKYKIRGSTLKYLLKKTASRFLPKEVLYRRKMGFGVPVGNWMRNELRPMLEDLLLAPNARISAYFQQAPMRQMVEEHVRGSHDHAYPLWALLWLELWHREFVV